MAKKIIPFVLAALLLTLAMGYHRALSTDEWLAESVSKNLELELASLEKEAQQISTDSLSRSWSSLHYSFYSIDDNRITNWSKNSFPIQVSDIGRKFYFESFYIHQNQIYSFTNFRKNQGRLLE